ncbi:MAG: 3-keto-5-aminohexanoate cleavage protein [Ruminococcaceae bacterium]|jgi:uncharacterized protein (DUF849 family)|nr:3-keto-5-aminohexanoate cleavage protein [Oscillospiraceae bacterium]
MNGQKKVILECRVNEYAMRDVNPHVPWTVQELVDEAQRVREAGAAIMHFHARTDDGAPNNRPEVYAEIIERVREKTDILLLPTLGYSSNDDDVRRIRLISRLAERRQTKPDIIPLDTGSINIDQFDAASGTFLCADAVYRNDTATLLYCADEMRARGIKCKFTCWDMGFVRRGVKLLESGRCTRPGYFLFHLTEGPHITGHPATPLAIDALRSVLPQEDCYWSCNCMGGNLLAVAPHVLANGGGLAIGLGDYHYAELGCPTNAQLLERVTALAREAGREIATPDEVRAYFHL